MAIIVRTPKTEYQKATQIAREAVDAAHKLFESDPNVRAARTVQKMLQELTHTVQEMLEKFARTSFDTAPGIAEAEKLRDAAISAAWTTLEARLKTLGINTVSPYVGTPESYIDDHEREAYERDPEEVNRVTALQQELRDTISKLNTTVEKMNTEASKNPWRHAYRALSIANVAYSNYLVAVKYSNKAYSGIDTRAYHAASEEADRIADLSVKLAIESDKKEGLDDGWNLNSYIKHVDFNRDPEDLSELESRYHDEQARIAVTETTVSAATNAKRLIALDNWAYDGPPKDTTREFQLVKYALFLVPQATPVDLEKNGRLDLGKFKAAIIAYPVEERSHKLDLLEERAASLTPEEFLNWARAGVNAIWK